MKKLLIAIIALSSFSAFAGFDCKNAPKASFINIINQSEDQDVVRLAKINLSSVREEELKRCSLSGKNLRQACFDIYDGSLAGRFLEYRVACEASKVLLRNRMSSLRKTYRTFCTKQARENLFQQNRPHAFQKCRGILETEQAELFAPVALSVKK